MFLHSKSECFWKSDFKWSQPLETLINGGHFVWKTEQNCPDHWKTEQNGCNFGQNHWKMEQNSGPFEIWTPFEIGSEVHYSKSEHVRYSSPPVDVLSSSEFQTVLVGPVFEMFSSDRYLNALVFKQSFKCWTGKGLNTGLVLDCLSNAGSKIHFSGVRLGSLNPSHSNTVL